MAFDNGVVSYLKKGYHEVTAIGAHKISPSFRKYHFGETGRDAAAGVPDITPFPDVDLYLDDEGSVDEESEMELSGEEDNEDDDLTEEQRREATQQRRELRAQVKAATAAAKIKQATARANAQIQAAFGISSIVPADEDLNWEEPNAGEDGFNVVRLPRKDILNIKVRFQAAMLEILS